MWRTNEQYSEIDIQLELWKQGDYNKTSKYKRQREPPKKVNDSQNTTNPKSNQFHTIRFNYSPEKHKQWKLKRKTENK